MWLIRLLIIGAASLTASVTAGPRAAAAVGSFALDSIEVSLCEPILVDLSTSDPGDGIGFDFDITYDPEVVQITDVVTTALTEYCGVGDVTFNAPTDPNNPLYGTVKIAFSCVNSTTPDEPITGSGPFLSIEVAPIANGSSALVFSKCTVNDEPCNVASSGSVDVTCFPAPDNCPYVDNPGQEDRGGVGAGSAPDGIGDACQCGDVNGSGFISQTDSVLVLRSRLTPPTAVLANPNLCDVGGPAGCSQTDSVILLRSLLTPPTASIAQQCAPANPPPANSPVAPLRRVVERNSADSEDIEPSLRFIPSTVPAGERVAVDIFVDPNGAALAAILLSLTVDTDGVQVVGFDAEPGVVSSTSFGGPVFSLGATFAVDRTSSFKIGTLYVDGFEVGGAIQVDRQSYTFADFTESDSRGLFPVVTVAAGTTSPSPAPVDTPGIPCVADCNNDGQVTVDELTRMVDLALKGLAPAGCGAGDRNGDGDITVDEIAAAISFALGGCSR